MIIERVVIRHLSSGLKISGTTLELGQLKMGIPVFLINKAYPIIQAMSVSDVNGQYTFFNVVMGRYIVFALHKGYNAVIQDNVVPK